MTRLLHDRFAKDYLTEALAPLGTIDVNREVAAEPLFVDVYFTPTAEALDYKEQLGVLGKMADSTALFEPFRNPAKISEVLSCLSKLFELRAELQRRARRTNTRLKDKEIPRLWILTPTASTALLDGFSAKTDEVNWSQGIYFLGQHFRTAIVAIHQLPVIPETLWLRLLGKGRVQQQAIAQLAALPTSNPLRANALELLYQLQSSMGAELAPELVAEDRELIMAVAPLFQQKLAEVKEEGRQEGRQEGELNLILRQVNRRFGSLAPELRSRLEQLSSPQLEDLAEALLDFTQIADLITWLEQQPK